MNSWLDLLTGPLFCPKALFLFCFEANLNKFGWESNTLIMSAAALSSKKNKIIDASYIFGYMVGRAWVTTCALW